jgi:hypothetical protein
MEKELISLPIGPLTGAIGSRSLPNNRLSPLRPLHKSISHFVDGIYASVRLPLEFLPEIGEALEAINEATKRDQGELAGRKRRRHAG